MHSSIIYICQDREATEVAINKCRDKEDVVYKYTMEYYSVIKKEQNSAICKIMDELTGCYDCQVK